MKHKTTMLKCLALLIFIGGISLAANSQDPPYVRWNTPGYSLSIIVPPAISTFSGTQISPDNSIYSIWLEKGDGNYFSTFSEGEIADIPAGDLITFPYLLASRLYETRKRPPTSARTTNIVGRAAVQPMMSSSQLADTVGMIKLFSNVRDIVANDTMVFGISYTPNANLQITPSRYKVIFRYNSQGQITFKPINSLGSYKVIDHSTQASIDLPYIRNYNNEIVSFATNPAESGNFSNVIIFDYIAHEKDTSNIFISMVPENNLPNTSNIEAELYYYVGEKGPWISAGISKIDDMVSAAFAHDPNSISVFPRCLSLPQKKRNLNYTINFQNTGSGDADTVKVAFYYPPQMNGSKFIENLRASYSENLNYPLKAPVYDPANGIIIFTLYPVPYYDVLDGSHVPNPVTNPKTMGQISFDLEIESGTDVNQSTILEAWAEIYFRGKSHSPFAISSKMVDNGFYIPNTVNFEMPVRTNNAITLFSNCCTGKPCRKCSHTKGFWKRLCCFWRSIVKKS